jgi:GT2 family glycosyltransferase
MKLSVIIVNYNVRHFLEQALLSVEKAAQGLEVEVFVVDNNSVDGSVLMVQEKFPQVKLIANRKNTGFSKANNQAILQATGEFVLLLNPDTIVEEDTFHKVIEFMDLHPEAGALGVKMLDGKGKFLPESKRGLPTPWVAFYKVFGLSALFPQSKKFGKYHLSYLSPDQNHEIEVLSGAFMLLRKTVLDKIGLLDEDYFMYGEDIDLSYRVIKAGYKNFYYSGTSIIHYKGESTKKGSLNYVKVFYQAMLIFARKHFSSRNQNLFILLIQIAIYLRAGLAVFNRIFQKTAFPIVEGFMIYGVIQAIKWYWETQHKYVEGGGYPLSFDLIAAPIYVVVLVLFLSIAGAYHKPYKSRKIISAAFFGFIAIATVSYLFPEINYSRAIVGLTSMFTVFLCIFNRFLLSLLLKGKIDLREQKRRRALIVGDTDEALRVSRMIRRDLEYDVEILGMLVPDAPKGEKIPEILGHPDQLEEALEVYRAEEIIFCNKSISTRRIIEEMARLMRNDLTFRIVPPDADYLIGPNQIHSAGDSQFSLNLLLPENRLRKRIFDTLFSGLLLLFFPFSFWIYRKPGKAGINLWKSFTGEYHLVGYVEENNPALPRMKHGLLNMQHILSRRKEPVRTDPSQLDSYYARTYSPGLDLEILARGFRSLGSDGVRN